MWSQGIGDQEVGDFNKEDRQLDSSFVSCEFVNHQYILSKWDYFCYLIGLGARVQTFFVAYVLYFVETENMCLVHWDSPRPLQTSTFTYQDNKVVFPAGYLHVDQFFNLIIFVLLIMSVSTTIAYVNKVIKVTTYHKADA